MNVRGLKEGQLSLPPVSEAQRRELFLLKVTSVLLFVREDEAMGVLSAAELSEFFFPKKVMNFLKPSPSAQVVSSHAAT